MFDLIVLARLDGGPLDKTDPAVAFSIEPWRDYPSRQGVDRPTYRALWLGR